jgi:transglutaminase/protease-like cytokinesis protein 3
MKRKVILTIVIMGPLLLTSCLMSQQYRIVRDLDSHAGSQRFDPARFRAIDEYALKAPDKAAASIDSLGAYLARPEWSELEKARAIWRWITANIDYDVGKHNYYAEETLRDRRGTCQGYAELFVLLARRAGVTALEITGYGRGSGFRPGGSVKNDHAWNAVRIDSRWYLLDITHGAGHVSGGHYNRHYQERYFLTPPGEFIYTDLPEVRRWQLIPDKLTKREFERLPLYRHGYFKYGLQLVEGARSCVIDCRGSTSLRFSVPEGVRLFADVRDRAGKSLFRPGVTGKGGIIEIKVEFSEPGDYYLMGWAGPESAPKDLTWAFSYLIRNR